MEVIISNWPGYIDPMKKPTSTVSVFQDRTGITVNYTDDVNDNSEFYAKVKNQLGACEPINRDMMMLTDWMAARMISLGWIQPLDKAKVPNLHANLIEPLRNRQWDPDLEFHAPWQSGLTGIAYNAAETGEVKSFEELITRSDLKGRITLLSEMRDTMGFMLKVQGADPSDFTEDEWKDAIDRLKGVVSAGQVRAFTGNEYIQDLAAGNIVACEAWSGDVIQAAVREPGHQVRHPRGRSVALERQHDRPEPGEPQGQRRGLDRLLLRAQDGGQARGLGELHLPRRGSRRRRWRRSTRPWWTTS